MRIVCTLELAEAEDQVIFTGLHSYTLTGMEWSMCMKNLDWLTLRYGMLAGGETKAA